jgi:hypothetical protein
MVKEVLITFFRLVIILSTKSIDIFQALWSAKVFFDRRISKTSNIRLVISDIKTLPMKNIVLIVVLLSIYIFRMQIVAISLIKLRNFILLCKAVRHDLITIRSWIVKFVINWFPLKFCFRNYCCI